MGASLPKHPSSSHLLAALPRGLRVLPSSPRSSLCTLCSKLRSVLTHWRAPARLVVSFCGGVRQVGKCGSQVQFTKVSSKTLAVGDKIFAGESIK